MVRPMAQPAPRSAFAGAACSARLAVFATSVLAAVAVACSSSDPSRPNAGSGGAQAGAVSAHAGAGVGGSAGSGVVGSSGAATGGVPVTSGACELTNERIRITEVDVGATVVNDEDEAALKPLSISPIPAGGSRVGWLGADGMVHVTNLDAADRVTGDAAAFVAKDFEDIYADDTGGVLLVTRDAQGGGTLNCGEPTNLCGTPPSPPVPCYDMYLVRFDGSAETWATKLTESSAALPPYSTGKTGADVTMIWWYAHHGQIAFDGANYAAYYGAAISVSQGGCINIHQGDRMDVVSKAGARADAGFGWGCSHSGYEHVIWDSGAKKFVTVCQNDAPTSGLSGKLAYAPSMKTLAPVDLWYSNVSELTLAKGGGYWTMTSVAQSGQPVGADGLADVHLLRFDGAASSQDVPVATEATNDRAPHLAAYGADHMIAAWESSSAKGHLARNDSNRKLYLRTLDRATGGAIGAPLQVEVKGNRYQELVEFPDGSVAFVAPGSSPSKLKILRVLPCEG